MSLCRVCLEESSTIEVMTLTMNSSGPFTDLVMKIDEIDLNSS